MQVKHAEILTKADEAKLWKSGVLGTTSHQSLQNAAFYVVGKMFSLRGGMEHHTLKLSQLQRITDPERYVYYENVSKHRNGFFKQIHLTKKVVPVYACLEEGEKCPVFILDEYIGKYPPLAVSKYLFYVRPLQNIPSDPTAPWYSAVPVGRNTLRKRCRLCVRKRELMVKRLTIA